MDNVHFYQESDQRDDLDLVLDIANDQIVIADGEGNLVRFSKSIEEAFGMTKEELTGKNVRELVREGVLSRSTALVVLKTKKKVTMPQTTQMGRRLMVNSIPVFNEEGEITKIISISKDITEISQLRQELKTTMEQLNRYRAELNKKTAIEQQSIMGNSPEMRSVLNTMSKVADLDVTVLIKGETGVGKSLAAQVIHEMSKRKDEPFVEVNCGALSESLLESELFGYEKGAFTGASDQGKKGMLEVADKGTLFLDEIGEVPLHLQVKLLNAIEKKEFYRLGSTKKSLFDARILVATNKNLEEMVEKGTFRKDLYYRLNIIPIIIPPLRERKDDLVTLAYYFLRQFNQGYGFEKKLSSEAYDLLTGYSWQGNVRELRNTIERLVITSGKDEITGEEVTRILDPEGWRQPFRQWDVMPLKKAREELEKEILRKAFDTYKTTRKIAEVLEVDQSTVVKKLHRYGIVKDDGDFSTEL